MMPLLLSLGSLSLGVTSCVGALEVYLYPSGLANLLELFSCTLYARYHNGDVPVFVVSVVGVCKVAVVTNVLVGLVTSVELVLKLI